MAEFAFEIKDVSKRYGQHWALARLSYALPKGKSLLLTGHNGSGKTTLLRMLATSTFPTFGSMTVLGMDTRASRDELRPKIALLSHASFLYEDLSARQNLRLLASLTGVEDPKKVCDELIKRVQLGTRADNPVREYSAGMRKRVAIARLLLKGPQLALLDEPFGELDPQGILDMEALIAELKNKGCALVLATHLIEQGQRLTEERLHLQAGRVGEVT